MRYLILLFMLIWISPLTAQDVIPYDYYDQNFNSTSDQSKIVYFSFLELEEKLEKNNLVTCYLNGKIRKYERFSNFKKKIRDGVTEELYENGTVRSQKNFKNGSLDGKFLTFWENSNLKRSDNYELGVFKDGKCYDKTGNEIDYYPYTKKAEYPGGFEKLNQIIQKKFNTNLIKDRKKLLVVFEVDSTGLVTDSDISNKKDLELAKYVVNLIKTADRWTPGAIDGKPVKTVYSLPINFTDGKFNISTDRSLHPDVIQNRSKQFERTKF